MDDILTGSETELIAQRDLARALHKSKAALAAWRRRGNGPVFTKVGQAVFYQRGDVIAWLERCKARSTDEARLHRRQAEAATTARQEAR